MLDAQQIAEIREMKEGWLVPHLAPTRAALDCDEEIREWWIDDESPRFIILIAKHHEHPEQDPQVASTALVAATAALEQRFREQAEKWGRETAHMSSPLQKMMHPSYQAILGMSAESPQNKREIIRFMLKDLKTSYREWSLALSYLTQQNPIHPKDYGKTDKIIAAWINWGEGQGLV